MAQRKRPSTWEKSGLSTKKGLLYYYCYLNIDTLENKPEPRRPELRTAFFSGRPTGAAAPSFYCLKAQQSHPKGKKAGYKPGVMGGGATGLALPLAGLSWHQQTLQNQNAILRSARGWRDKPVDDTGITWHLSTGLKKPADLSLFAHTRETVVAHSRRPAPSACQTRPIWACPQTRPSLTTTTMY